MDFLKSAGLYRGVTDNPMRLGISSRSKDVIEPLLKPQWWVACSDMAARSCQAVRTGALEIIPKVGVQHRVGCRSEGQAGMHAALASCGHCRHATRGIFLSCT